LLLVPDLIALDLPALIRQAGYPGTRVVPAASWPAAVAAGVETADPGPGGSPTSMTCC